MDHRLTFRALQIHRQAALVAVEGGKKPGPKPAETAGMVALRRRLDLDDVGAELGKHQPGGRAHDRMAELQDSYAGERRRRHQAAARRRKASRLPAWINSPGNWCPTISSAMRPTSISASRSTPVSMPISSQSNTSSSVQILPAASGCPANGQPPSPPTVESNWVTPILSPACALATASPRVSCKCSEIGVSGQRLRTSPKTRSIRIGVAQPLVSASEKYLRPAPASSGIASPSSH